MSLSWNTVFTSRPWEKQGSGNGSRRRSVEVPAYSGHSGPSSSAQPTTQPSTGAPQARTVSPSRSRTDYVWSTTRVLKSKAQGLWDSVLTAYPYLASHVQHITRGSTTATSATATLGETLTEEAAFAGRSSAGSHAASSKHAHGTTVHNNPVLSEFLQAADHLEISYASLLSDLSNIAYDISLLTSGSLWELHSLELVSSSASCMLGPRTRESWMEEVQEQRNSRSTSPNRASSAAGAAGAEGSGAATGEAAGSRLQRRSGGPYSGAAPSAEAIAAALQMGADAAVATAQLMQQQDGSGADTLLAVRSHRLSHQGSSGSASPVLTPSVSLVSLRSLDEAAAAAGGPNQADAQYPVLTFVPASPARSPRHSLDGADSRHMPAGAIEVVPPEPLSSPNSSAAAAGKAAAGGLPSKGLPPVQVPVTNGKPGAAAEEQPVSPQAGAVACSGEPPAAWFAADDPVTHVRYFVIQGSTNFEHWQINFQFEPVIFEDPALGVRVHRGVYQAALQLYDDLLPLVRQHLAATPCASVAFTGHSLGGSLATVLMMLFVHRGVLPPESVSPVYTFGAPAVFCGGADKDAPADRCEHCGLDCEVHKAAPGTFPEACAKPRGLLQSLGMSDDHVVNIIMHRDIVPRAFACDYTIVADLLKQWVPSLKDHALLQGPAHAHKSLYNFLGRMAIIKPDPTCHFVTAGDAHHALLPHTPGLYRLVTPPPPLRVHTLGGSYDLIGGVAKSVPEAAGGAAAGAKAGGAASVAAAAARKLGFGLGGAKGGKGGEKGDKKKRPETLREATVEFLNSPHPLTTLSEYSAYGANGSISRYHNPDNYTKGLLGLIGQAPHQVKGGSAVTAPPDSRVMAAKACPLGPAAATLAGAAVASAHMRKQQQAGTSHQAASSKAHTHGHGHHGHSQPHGHGQGQNHQGRHAHKD